MMLVMCSCSNVLSANRSSAILKVTATRTSLKFLYRSRFSIKCRHLRRPRFVILKTVELPVVLSGTECPGGNSDPPYKLLPIAVLSHSSKYKKCLL